MTVSYGAPGGVTAGTTSVAPAYPTGITAGDMLVCTVAWGNSMNTPPPTPTGWSAPAGNTHVGGAGSWGLDTGPRGVTQFCRVADGSESGTVTVDNGGGSNPTMLASIIRASRSLTGWAEPTCEGGADTTSGTSFSVTAGSDPGGRDGDLAVVGVAWVPNGTTGSGQTLTWTGTGSGALTWRNQGATGGGYRVRLFHGTRSSTGTSSAAPVVAMTGAAAVAGAAQLMVLRDINVYAAAGTIAASSGLSGTATATLTASGAVAGTSGLSGAVTVVTGSTTHQVSGTITATSGASGSITARLATVGAVTATSSVSGTVTASLPISGTITATSGVTGSATARLATSGTIPATSALSGAVTIVTGPATYQASGTIAATSTTTGTLTATLPTSGAVTAVSSLTGNVTITSGPATYQVTGNIAATSAATGSVTASLTATGTVGATAALTGTVTATLTAAGTATATSGASGAISRRRPTSGTITATSTLTGSATVIPAGGNPAPPTHATPEHTHRVPGRVTLHTPTRATHHRVPNRTTHHRVPSRS